MKVGLTTSVVLHAAALGFGLFSLSSPRPLEVADFESFPVDIVPIEEFSQSVRGEREAPVAEIPAPKPTTREDPVETASNVGDNTVDLPNAPTVTPRERPVETASLPPPPPPEPTPAPQPTPRAEAAPPPPEPQAEAAPAPAPAATPTPDAVQLPDRAPVPTARPRETPRTQTAAVEQRPQQRQETPQPQRERAEDNSKFNEDQIAALLNRDRPSGGGAQRSTQEAALGGRQTTGAKLSQSEIDALRSQVQRCWNPPVGVAEAENMIVSIRIKLSPSGALESDPQVVAGGGASIAERAAADAARRAVLRCAPFNAPSDKYEAWADVQFNFDPRDMF